jgi:hypothetical protein
MLYITKKIGKEVHKVIYPKRVDLDTLEPLLEKVIPFLKYNLIWMKDE